MTIIAAVHDAKQRCTWIGADSRVSNDGTVYPITCRKIKVDGHYAIGASGWANAVSIIQRMDDLFKGGPAAQEVADRIQEKLRASNWREKDDSGPHSYGCYFILVIGRDVYDIDGSLDVCRIDDGALWARGSGAPFAIGAGAALEEHVSGEERIRSALNVAARFESGCAAPFFVHRVDWP